MGNEVIETITVKIRDRSEYRGITGTVVPADGAVSPFLL